MDRPGSGAPVAGRWFAREGAYPPHACVLKDIDHQDGKLPSNVAAGFSITGLITISRAFDPRRDANEVVGETKERSCRRAKGVRDVVKEVFMNTEEEVTKGWASEPYTEQQSSCAKLGADPQVRYRVLEVRLILISLFPSCT